MDVKEIKLYKINNHYIVADCIYHAIQIWQDYAERNGIDCIDVVSLSLEDDGLLAENNKQYYAVQPTCDCEIANGLLQEDAVEEADEEKIEDAEKRLILAALERNQGNRKAAAAELGISERTIYRKMIKYALS